MTRRKLEYWVIPPEADGEFVASMAVVLETYTQPYDARYPVWCMDEQPACPATIIPPLRIASPENVTMRCTECQSS